MYWLIFSLFISVTAGANNSALYEKTFPRDNTYCMIGKNRIEISLRGFNKFTEPKDRGYAENAFYDFAGGKKQLKLADGNSGLYKFFKGTKSKCSKSWGLDMGQDKFAVFFLKENSPHQDKLIIQLFDAKSGTPLEVLHTNYLTDKAVVVPQGISFRHNGERLDLEMGKVTIEGNDYRFQDRDFPQWIKYNLQGFVWDEVSTFKHFPFKGPFKDLNDFLTATAWSPANKQFGNKTLYLAVNHALKKECVLFVAARQKITGSEPWKCRQR